MLELRPVCENCNKALPPNSKDAMICSYECTFCKQCVDEILQNVCPNCGGGLCIRPVRPAHNLKDGNYLGNDPATLKIIYKPVDRPDHNVFNRSLKNIPPYER